MNKRITIKDIASHLGVHVSTVSRALNPEKSGNLSAAAIEKVRVAASELGYRPNRLAAGLRTRRSMTIGVMIPDISNVLFPPIVRGIESVLEPLGYASVLVNTDSDSAREARLVEVLRDRGVDGIIHAAVLRDDPTIVRAFEDGIPVVTMNRKVEGVDIPYLINDEEDGIRQIITHLFDLGHRHIAHLAGPQELSTGLMRREAFQKVISEIGLPLSPATVVVAEQFTEDEGRRCARDLLDTGATITAICCANDRLALGAIAELHTRGIRCPKDVSVTGFNDMPFLNLIPPSLTTVRIQQFEAGQKCATRLVGMIDECKEAAEPQATILPVELVVRDSSAPA